MKSENTIMPKELQNEFVIRIKPNGNITVEDITDGIVSFKNISYADIINAFKGSIIDKKVYIASGMLPQNCITFKGDDKGNKYVVTEYNLGYADITYGKTLYTHFPLPKMVFGFYLNHKNRITTITVGVTANEKLTESSQMYVYPLSNVSGFKLCTGTNQLPEIKSLQQLSNLPWYILGIPDNDDSYNERNNMLRFGHRALMEYMKNKDSKHYYEKLLIPMEAKTLKDFINLNIPN